MRYSERSVSSEGRTKAYVQHYEIIGIQRGRRSNLNLLLHAARSAVRHPTLFGISCLPVNTGVELNVGVGQEGHYTAGRIPAGCGGYGNKGGRQRLVDYIVESMYLRVDTAVVALTQQLRRLGFLVSSRARCTRPRAVVPCLSFVPVYSTHDAYTRGSPPYIHDGASSVLLTYSRGTQKYERRRWCCNSSRLYFCIELLGTEIIDTRCCLGWWRKTYGKMREKTMQTIFSQREIPTTKQIDAKVLLAVVII